MMMWRRRTRQVVYRGRDFIFDSSALVKITVCLCLFVDFLKLEEIKKLHLSDLKIEAIYSLA